ncbi:MAG: TIGR04283 family arsenosugar biosynthesis glycosyltransferase [Verrucomicrobiota bacterium]|nr:TIGR04283 family arsenosugar biosynthesis glycosyltransferase [Verrucomicrobiota bacterium]
MFNEARLIAPFLRQLRERAIGAKIIVVDGGSNDGTPEQARGLCDLLLTAPRGRGQQLNAGAAASSADTLWFLHADCEIASGSLARIEEALRDPKVIGGYFRIQLPRNRAVYRWTDSFAHYAGNVLRIRCGDHGFFCRRAVFGAIGGFPNVPLMEDVEFYRALHRHGEVVALEPRLRVSSRRYEEVGAWRLTLAYGLIATLYALGIPLSALSKIYQRMCA